MLICTLAAMAQSSMSDSQVVDFVLKEQKAGTSQAQIVTKLMQRGVDIQQIRRLKKMYDSQSKGQSLGHIANEGSTTSDSRMRKNNGDTKSFGDNTAAKNSTTTNKVANGQKATHTYDLEDEDYVAMRNEMRSLLPDSLEYGEDDMLFEDNVTSTRKVFGRDIFNKKNLTFEPNMNIATPQNYRLGPGDVIYVDIYGATQKTQELTVSPDGEVTIEGYGPVHVSGLTVDQANSRLRSTLGTRYASSKIKLTVGQTRTIMVNVMGEVALPGA